VEDAGPRRAAHNGLMSKRAPHEAHLALQRLLSEVFNGPAPDAAFVLNRGDRGLLASLAVLTAEAASACPDGRSSIAAHVHHLWYGFHLLNRWAAGEDPWDDADYAASWRRQEVTADEWHALQEKLAGEAETWVATAGEPREWDRDGWANALSSVVHLAYHLGAIRQLEPATSGPPARD
jgi:hypothetical protein